MKHLIVILIALMAFSCGSISTTEAPIASGSTPVVVAGPFPEYSSAWGLKRSIYDKAVRYYSANEGSIRNKRYFVIADFSQHSSKRRLYLFDLEAGKLTMHNTSHGAGSDRDGDGYATDFSNVSGSHKSSLGFYKTAETYNGGNGYSLRLDGLESSNSKARSRAIVIHPASYVKDGSRAGRSWGCPALDPSVSRSIIDKIKGGAILLIDR